MPTQAQTQGLGEFVRWEFTLEHIGDDELLLLHQGELATRFSQTGATEQGLQAECALHLAKCHGWDGCLWSRKEIKHDSLPGI